MKETPTDESKQTTSAGGSREDVAPVYAPRPTLQCLRWCPSEKLQNQDLGGVQAQAA